MRNGFRVVFCLLLVAWCTVTAGAGTLLDLVPEQAGVVFRADLAKLTALGGQEAAQSVKDVVTDAREAVSFFLAGATDGWNKPEVAFLLNGTFTEKAVLDKLAERKNGKATTWEGSAGWQFNTTPAVLLVFLDKTTIGIGQESALKAVLGAKKNPRQSAAGQPTWQELFKQASGQSAWMGSALSADLKAALKAMPIFTPLAGLTTAEIIGTMGKEEAEIKGTLTAATPSEAEQCRDFFLNAVAALKAFAGAGTPQEKILSGTDIQLQGSALQVSLKWPRGHFASLITVFKDYVGQKAPAGK